MLPLVGYAWFGERRQIERRTSGESSPMTQVATAAVAATEQFPGDPGHGSRDRGGGLVLVAVHERTAARRPAMMPRIISGSVWASRRTAATA
jgi:hypothetical protein